MLSIAAQVEELKNLAQRRGFTISGVLTESQSAKSPGRPIFGQLLKRISRGEVQGILCWKLDRLARNPVDGGAVIWGMKQHELHIHTPTQTYSTAEDNTILMYIEFGMAQKYVDDLSQNVKRGNRMKLENGGLPGLAPQGYINDLVNHTVVPDPERFHLVQRMWNLMLTGSYTVAQIARIANEDWGYRTRKLKRIGGGRLHMSCLYKIFSNPFYYGLIKRKVDGNLASFAGAHRPMVTEDEFQRVQHLLGRSDRPRPRKHRFPYIGLMRCGECSGTITAETHTKPSGKRYVYYRCTKKIGPCSQPYVPQSILEELIYQELKSISVSDDFRDWALKYVWAAHGRETEARTTMYKNQQEAYNTAQKKIDRLMDMHLQNLITAEEYRAKRETVQCDMASLKLKLADTEDRAKKWLELTEQAIFFANRAKKVFDEGNEEKRREIVMGLGSNFFLKDKKVQIELQEPFRLAKKANHKSQQPRLSPRLFALGRPKARSSERLLDQIVEYFRQEKNQVLYIPKLDLS